METLSSAIYATLISFVINIFLCPVIIPFLRKLKFGQYIRSDGPQTHLKKSGTPTMGGVIIIASFMLTGLFFINGNRDGIVVMLVTLGYGVIGFLDDYIKVAMKRSLGLRAYQKIIAQIIISLLFYIYIVNYSGIGTDILIPFTNGVTFDLGIFYFPFVLFILIGTVNSVNLTDGLDGLASGVTLLVAVFLMLTAWATGSGVMSIAGAACGSLLGFLLFNSHPARVFMGDTGSLALGGFIASSALILRMPIFLAIVGLVYVVEALSVIIQVSSYKLFKKRVFKMAPIHHHFELLGFSETRVVTIFYVTTALFCLMGFLAAKNIF